MIKKSGKQEGLANGDTDGTERGVRRQPKPVVEAVAAGRGGQRPERDVVADETDPDGVRHPPIEARGPEGRKEESICGCQKIPLIVNQFETSSDR